MEAAQEVSNAGQRWCWRTSSEDVDEPDLLQVDLVNLPAVVRGPALHRRMSFKERSFSKLQQVCWVGSCKQHSAHYLQFAFISDGYEGPAQHCSGAAGVLRIDLIHTAQTQLRHGQAERYFGIGCNILQAAIGSCHRWVDCGSYLH